MFSANNKKYIQSIYNQWKDDPNSVDLEWSELFENQPNILTETPKEKKAPAPLVKEKKDYSFDIQNILNLANTYRKSGFYLANKDLLDKNYAIPSFDMESYNISQDQLKKEVAHNDLSHDTTVGNLITSLVQQYCSDIHYLISSANSPKHTAWWQRKIEKEIIEFSDESKRRIYTELLKAEEFEDVLTNEESRLQGFESIIPSISEIMNYGLGKGVEHIIMSTGMQARSNILYNIFDLPLSECLKPNCGGKKVRRIKGKEVTLSLAWGNSYNVKALTEGEVKSHQDNVNNPTAILALHIHTADDFVTKSPSFFDALKGSEYKTSGSIHLILNNQNQRDFSSLVRISKTFNIPLINVKSSNVENIISAMRLAVDYRHGFERDIIINIQQFTTDDLTTNDINEELTSIRLKYRKTLTRKEVISDVFEIETSSEFQHKLSSDVEKLKEIHSSESAGNPHKDLHEAEEYTSFTGVEYNTLSKVLKTITAVPANLSLSDSDLTVFADKKETINNEFSEEDAMAFALGSLLIDGFNVRFTTDKNYNLVFHDQRKNEKNEDNKVNILNYIEGASGVFISPKCLSKREPTLAFEYGYNISSQNSLGYYELDNSSSQYVVDKYIALRYSKSNLIIRASYNLARFLQLASVKNMTIVNPTTSANTFHAIRRQAHSTSPLILTGKAMVRSHINTILSETKFVPILDDSAIANKPAVRRILLCTGHIYHNLDSYREKEKIDDIAIIRIEQLFPWKKDQLKDILLQYKHADVVWVQEETANNGAYTYVLPRLIVACQSLGLSVSFPAYAGNHEQENKPLSTIIHDAFHKEWNDLIYFFDQLN